VQWWEDDMNKTTLSVILLFVIAYSSQSDKDDKSSLVTVESPSVKNGEQLLKEWQLLPSRIRKKIESEIVVGNRLGLSSTGIVQLIGIYNQPEGEGDKAKTKRLFHLRQTDLFGERLFWSVLVNAEDETYRILFHINEVGDRDASWLKLGDR
jgi:hypothetical protein